MDYIERVLYAAAKMLSCIGMLLLLAFAAATLLDGALRSLFTSPIDIVRDCGGVVVAVAISSCFPQLVLERGNIAISFVEGMLGRFGNASLNLFAAFCTSVVCFAIAWQFLAHAENLRRGTEKTPLLGIPTAPFWYFVDTNFWICALAQLVVLVQTARGRAAASLGHEIASTEELINAPSPRRVGAQRGIK